MIARNIYAVSFFSVAALLSALPFNEPTCQPNECLSKYGFCGVGVEFW
jgi:hypothetical protein